MRKSTTDVTPNELLIYERERRHWTQKDLADRIEGLREQGESERTKAIRRWENGNVKRPEDHYLRQLENIFERSAEQLGYPDEGKIPFWSVPRPRNPFFIGREETLGQIHALLASRKPRAILLSQALTGLGGIGKTQIAIEYAYRYMHEYHTVVWLRAHSPEILASDFAAIATLLDLPISKYEKDQDMLIQAVKAWLAHPRITRWLLIFDNFESADDLQGSADFIPLPCNGHVILTTRLQATGTRAQKIEVEAMKAEEGAEFLLKRAKLLDLEAALTDASESEYNQAIALSQSLDGLPLALDQAGGFIEEKGIDLSRYADLYRTRRAELHQLRGSYSKEYPHSVATTWSLAFEKIQQANPTANDLLRLSAFFAPDAIPEEIVSEGGSALSPLLEEIVDNPVALDTAIGELLTYSLVHRSVAAKTYTIHPLVQAVLQDEMDKDTQRQWAERAAQSVNQVLPDFESKMLQQYSRLYPHILRCTSLIKQWDITSTEAASLLFKAARYSRYKAQYTQAERLYKQALPIYEKTWGTEHVLVAQCLDDLAEVYREWDKHDQAESLYKEAIALLKGTPNEMSHEFASFLNDLAMLYDTQGKYTEAETLFHEAIAIHQQIPGPQNILAAYTFNNLGNLYNRQGNYTGVERLYSQAIAIGKELLGTEDSDIAIWYNNLAMLKLYQEKYTEAETLLRQSLAIYEKTLGTEHPLAATSLTNLGLLYYRQGKYTEAEPFFRQSLSIRQKTLGPKHHLLAQSLSRMGLIFCEYGDYTEAETLLQQAIDMNRETLGEDHPYQGVSLYYLGKLYHKQGRYNQAEALYKQALAILEKSWGLDHPYAADGLYDLGVLYTEQKRYTEAESLLQRVLANREKRLGPEDAKADTILDRLTDIYRKQARLDRAFSLWEQVLKARQDVLGSNHPLLAKSLESYASLLHEVGRHEEAREHEMRAQLTREKQAEKTSG